MSSHSYYCYHRVAQSVYKNFTTCTSEAFALIPPKGPCAGSFLSWHLSFCEGTFPSATPCISKNLGPRKLERKVKECDMFPCF